MWVLDFNGKIIVNETYAFEYPYNIFVKRHLGIDEGDCVWNQSNMIKGRTGGWNIYSNEGIWLNNDN